MELAMLGLGRMGSLFSHFASQGASAYGDKLLSALRAEFGGHREPAAPEGGAMSVPGEGPRLRGSTATRIGARPPTAWRFRGAAGSEATP